MSAVAIVLLVFPIMIVLGALLYLLNKLLPGGLLGSFSADDETQIAVTGDKSDKNALGYKLKQKKKSPGEFIFVKTGSEDDDTDTDDDYDTDTDTDDDDDDDEGDGDGETDTASAAPVAAAGGTPAVNTDVTNIVVPTVDAITDPAVASVPQVPATNAATNVQTRLADAQPEARRRRRENLVSVLP
tara:strand:- start:25666 stop:26223 length:558 start_codon:yes stop_codon:yes gene_type:complete